MNTENRNDGAGGSPLDGRVRSLATERDYVLAMLEESTNQTWIRKRRRAAALIRAMAAEIERLRMEADNAAGMAGCMVMLHNDLRRMELIPEATPPMFLTEAVCGAIRREVLVEREACACVCDTQAAQPECPERAVYCAAAIRERSNVGVEAPLTAQQEYANGTD